MPDAISPRGIRNNNPGNIRITRDKWQGLAEQQNDKEFFMFSAPEWGIRAMARILIRHQDVDGCTSIAGHITRYAPPSENNTEAYIVEACLATQFARDQVLDVHHYPHCRPLVEAIIRRENGQQPYSDAVIDRALALAGVLPPAKPLSASRTLRGAKLAAGSTIGTALAGALEPIAKAQDSLSSLAQILPAARWALLALVLAGVGITAYARMDDAKRRLT